MITKAKTAKWTLRYRFNGMTRELTLGRYPAMSLGKARQVASWKRTEIEEGIDPLAEKNKRAEMAARANRTFNDLLDDYLAKAGPELAPTTVADLIRQLNKDVRPLLGKRTAREIEPSDVVTVVEKVGKRSKSVARRIYEILSVIFKHGVARAFVPANPMANLSPRAVLGAPPAKRKRLMLTDAELRVVLAASLRMGPVNALALRILLATCVRKSELFLARPEHLDLERGLWTIPDEISKTRSGYTVPLAPLVVTWFGQLLEIAQLMGNPWVVPGRDNGHICVTTINTALTRLEVDVRRFTPHDLRSTARSHLVKLGVDVLVAERCLNHSLGGLVAIYDQHDYLDERRAALELWARHLESLEKPAEVISINRAA
ncbi:MAG: tyrosine-type recombinase/integrase [Burkholderiales bacterium]|nr:tyrosine-type recombinase/integrase [Burkholderiales bacterium]